MSRTESNRVESCQKGEMEKGQFTAAAVKLLFGLSTGVKRTAIQTVVLPLNLVIFMLMRKVEMKLV